MGEVRTRRSRQRGVYWYKIPGGFHLTIEYNEKENTFMFYAYESNGFWSGIDRLRGRPHLSGWLTNERNHRAHVNHPWFPIAPQAP
jgi:hypothetical protein